MESVVQPASGVAPDLIFADGFESGDFSAWTSSTTDSGDLNVSDTAALDGAYGMRAVINDNNAIYVTDDSPSAETRYRARFYFDPNSISMTSGNAHYILYGYTGTSTAVLRAEFRYSSGNYQIRLGMVNDSTTWSNTSWYTISDDVHVIELDWKASTGAGANNGSITLWIDDDEKGSVTGIDNDTRVVDRVRLGPVSGIDSGTRGTYFFDAFESRYETYIGPIQGEGSTVESDIYYGYDPLYRLVSTEYDGGPYWYYEYDAVGNRLSETTGAGTTTYEYDDANRLTDIDATELTWDNNGNLLDDGTTEYTYDHANRLASVTQGVDTYEFSYNGLGDRLVQSVNSSPTDYTLDLSAGLTEVLADGTNAYLYGLTRIGEDQPGGWQYHATDALGSLRQLLDASGEATLEREYSPYGEVASSAGAGSSAFGFTGEQTDITGLTYLRARYYSPIGRFLTRDTWGPSPYLPMTYNAWQYAYSNPTNRTDPSGHQVCRDDECVDSLEYYNVTGWMVRAMAVNSDSPEVQHIRQLNSMASPFIVSAPLALLTSTIQRALQGELQLSKECILRLLGAAEDQLREDPHKAEAYDAWTALVKDQARWDFKYSLKRLLPPEGSIRLCSPGLCQWFDRDVPGNIHYGYVGRAAGFISAELHVAASIAQQQGDSPERGTWSGVFDDPVDFEAIELGIGLYNRSGSGGLDPSTFRRVLPLYWNHLHSAQPPTPPYRRYPYPYDVGLGPRYPTTFFDGGSGN